MKKSKLIFIILFFIFLSNSAFTQVVVEDISIGSRNYGIELRPPFIIARIKNTNTNKEENLLIKAFVNNQPMLNEEKVDVIFPNQEKKVKFFWKPDEGVGTFSFRVEICEEIPSKVAKKVSTEEVQFIMKVAYENTKVHRWITIQAINFLKQKTIGYNEIVDNAIYRNLIIDGSVDEDDVEIIREIGPDTVIYQWRYNNHFYRPTDWKGLNIFANESDPIELVSYDKFEATPGDDKNPWNPARNEPNCRNQNSFEWGAQQNEDNDYDWYDALNYYKSNNKPAAYYALGHVLHLIEDLTVPAHTHLDIHIGKEILNIIGFSIKFDEEDYEDYMLESVASEDTTFYKNEALKNDVIYYRNLHDLWMRVSKESYFRNRFYQVLDNVNHTTPVGSNNSAIKYLKDIFPSLKWSFLEAGWEIDEAIWGEVGIWHGSFNIINSLYSVDYTTEWWECKQLLNDNEDSNWYYIENTDEQFPKWIIKNVNIHDSSSTFPSIEDYTFVKNNEELPLVTVFADQLIPIAIRASAGAIKMFIDTVRNKITINYIQIDPSSVNPGQSFEIRGYARYDTNDPVEAGNVIINVGDTPWQTAISNGYFSRSISAPSKPGRYSISVYVFDGSQGGVQEGMRTDELIVSQEEIAAPNLISPSNGAVLDNGKQDGTDPIVWDFDWSDVTGVESYHLNVIHEGSSIPFIDNSDISSSTSYYHCEYNGYIADKNRLNWTWKVCAKINGQWGPWSETRYFDVAPIFIPTTITLSSPNGCESWTAGTSHNITWTSTGVTNVKIEYSLNNGLTWTTITSITGADAGSYPWIVPNSPSMNCIVRISDTSNSTINDLSDVSFVISQPSGGLADSAWPMFRQNLQHTGRGNATIAASSTVKWKFQLWNDTSSTPSMGSSSAISSDGTIYVGSINCIYAVKPDGTLKWKFDTEGSASSAAIGSDGTVYVGSWYNNLYAINSDGTLKWKFDTGSYVQSSPAIGSDGTVYIGSWGTLFAIQFDGSLKWKYQTGGGPSSPAIGSDGTIYIGAWDNHLYAINADGTLKWKYQTGNLVSSSPAIGSDGTVYVGSIDNYLYTVRSDGTLKWKYQTGGIITSSPAISSDGTVYVGSGDNYLYAILSDGTLKWKFQTEGAIQYSSPAIGSDGTVYVGSYYSYIYAVKSDGTLKWKFHTGGSVTSSPVIGSEGTMYIAAGDNYLYTFAPETTSLTLTSPIDSEAWTVGTSHNITWNYTSVSNVKIEYSIDNGVSWTMITTSTPASAGSYVWTIPNTPSINCIIKITDATNSTVSSYSKDTFTILSKELRSPSNFTVSDIPNDNGHQLYLNWNLSPDDAIITYYYIYRSRNSEFSDQVLNIEDFSSIDDLKNAEINSTILIAKVQRGINYFIDSYVPFNNVIYYYWLRAVSISGSSEKVAASIITSVQEKPTTYHLGYAHPNPFNPSTTIDFSLARESYVLLKVYNLAGQAVTTLKDEKMTPGLYSVVWHAQGLPTGLYFYVIKADGYSETKKMILVK